MSISAIGGVPNAVAAQHQASSRASSLPPPQAAPAATAAISKPGDLMNKLQQLLQKDPVKFKALMTQLSGAASTAAGSATGEQAVAMTKLSESFAQAATSGSLASFKPHAGTHAHPHHPAPHPTGVGSASQSLLQNALDKVNEALGIDPHAPESAQPMAS